MSDLISPEAKAALKEVLGTFQIHRMAAMEVAQVENWWDEDYPGQNDPRQSRILVALKVLTLEIVGEEIDEGAAHAVALVAPLPKDIVNHPMSIEEMTLSTQAWLTESGRGGEG